MGPPSFDIRTSAVHVIRDITACQVASAAPRERPSGLASLGVTTSGVSHRASLTCPYDLLAWPRTNPPTVAAHRRKPQLRRRAITCFTEHRDPIPSGRRGGGHRLARPALITDRHASSGTKRHHDRRRYLHMTNLLPAFYYLEVR
jgi:hypothetical protein